MRIVAVALIVSTSFGVTTLTAGAEPFNWSYEPETKALVGMEEIYEGDYSFHAVCQSPQHVKLGIGAQTGVGKGAREKVSVTLASAARNVRIEGKSGNSANFEMTAGVELQATISATHPVFQLLLDSGPTTVTGDLQETWPAAGRTSAVRKFLAACKPQ